MRWILLDYNATVKDVARLAGVSVATVTRSLQYPDMVKAKTRARVLECIDQLHYVPSGTARQLRTLRSHTIGHIFSTMSPESPFTISVALAAERELNASGFDMFSLHSNIDLNDPESDPARELHYVRLLAEWRVEGIIFTRATHPGSLEFCARHNIPVVQVGRPLADHATDCVICDNFMGAATATRHLIELGHLHIAFLGPAPVEMPEIDRLQGYKQALSDAGLPEYITEIPYKRTAAYAATADLLDRHPAVTALFTSDPMVPGVLQALYERGLKVPAQFSLIGYDDTLAPLMAPPLTTVRVPIEEFGFHAARLIIEAIAEKQGSNRAGGGQAELRVLKLETSLVVRGSTAPPATHAKDMMASC